MEGNIPQAQWQCIGKSVAGSSHDRSGLANQDAIKFYPESGVVRSVILAVSDGHGSAKSFRSHKGSRFAVETAVAVIRQEFLLNSPSSASALWTAKDRVKSRLPTVIVNAWRKAVHKDLGLPMEDYAFNKKDSNYPPNFTGEDEQIVVQKDGQAAWQAVKNNHFLAYGATLLAVLVTENYIVYIQLGDGDILEVDSDGDVTRPLERDPKLIANETTSLCMDKAWNEFQVQIKLYSNDTPEKMPALILVSTDGYSNSFSTDQGFERIGKDYRQMFKSNLAKEIKQQLEGFLRETSEKGSGDDITLGIIKRLENDDRDYQKKGG